MNAQTSDTILIDASIRGDRAAFREIVAKYQSLVCSVAYSFTGDLAQSEDLAQETFIVAWQKLETLEDREKLSAWLCGIVKNIARDTHRRSKRDLSYHATPLDEAVAAVNAVHMAECVSESERETVMWAALEEIPENYREPLILYYRRGESVREVAEALDISEDAAKQRLSRGRKMLKEQVVAFVEKSLSDTNPGTAFTIAVIATLPALTTSTAAAAMTSSSITGAAATGKGTINVALWTALVGSIAFMTLGLLNLWLVIRTAPDSQTRRQIVRYSAGTISIYWSILGLLSVVGSAAAPQVGFEIPWLGGGLVAIAGVVVAIVFCTRRVKAFDGGSKRYFAGTSVVTLTGSMLFVFSTSWIAFPFLLVSHVVCVKILVRGWRMTDDELASDASTMKYSPKWALLICAGMVVVAIPFVRQFGVLISDGEYVAAIAYAPMIMAIPLVLFSAVTGVIESAKPRLRVPPVSEHSAWE